MSSKSLSEKELNEIKRTAEELKKAAKDAADGYTRLWSSTIDMAIATGDVESVRSLVTRPGSPGTQGVWGDNNCQCSAKPLQPGFGQPGLG
jgi:hypothetical protein